MYKLARILGISAAILIALLSAAPAAAMTISPSGTYRLTAGTTILRLRSNGLSSTCQSSEILMSVASFGVGIIPLGGLNFGSCTNPLIGRFTVEQPLAWAVVMALLPEPFGSATRIGAIIRIPRDGMELRGAACSVWLGSGNFLTAHLYPGLPVVVSTADVFTTAVTVMTVTRTNCSPLTAIVGLNLDWIGSYTFDRSMIVSP
jgi:hypothetical protein